MRDPQEMLTHHLLDSLAAVLPLRRHLAQLAQSGAVQGRGCACWMWAPAVACRCGVCHLLPRAGRELCGHRGQKAAFIQQAAVALKLRNLHGLHARVETLTEAFDVVSCRAFASLPDFVVWSRSALAASHGVWLAMKGKHPADEMLRCLQT